MGWGGVGWGGVGWDGMGWDGMGWDGMGWDGMGWGGMGWDGMGRSPVSKSLHKKETQDPGKQVNPRTERAGLSWHSRWLGEQKQAAALAVGKPEPENQRTLANPRHGGPQNDMLYH